MRTSMSSASRGNTAGAVDSERMHHQIHFRSLAGFLVLCASSALRVIAAEPIEVDPGLDTTVLHSRVRLGNEFIDRDDGASKNTTKLSLAYAFGRTSQRDWSIQLELPLVAVRGGAGGSATGFGDASVRLVHVVDPTGVFRWAAGVETQFNTAAQDQLGDGVFRVSPLLGFALQPSATWKFQTVMQFDQSLTRESGVSEQQELKLMPSLQCDLPNGFFAFTETELKWNLRDNNAFGAKLKFEIGRGFGSHDQWVMSARYEVPLTESDDEHTFSVGFAYVFP